MNSRPTVLERAFSLARSGDYPSVAGIRAQLKVEGYPILQLEGRTLLKQLREICQTASSAKPEPAAE